MNIKSLETKKEFFDLLIELIKESSNKIFEVKDICRYSGSGSRSSRLTEFLYK